MNDNELLHAAKALVKVLNEELVRGPDGMVKMKDIADNLGVSIMTVSKALRDSPDLSHETVVKVNAEAVRLSFQPNLCSQIMRGGKPPKIFNAIARLEGAILYEERHSTPAQSPASTP